MPKLTVPTLAKYKPQKERREIRDTLAPGLRLIIQPSGARSWAMRFRRPDGRPAKLTLGKYVEVETGENPVIGAALTLSQARELAIRVDRERTLGKDVIEERKAEKSRRRDEDKDRAENTFGVLAVEFFRSYRTKWGARPRRWRNDAAILGLRWPDSDPSKTDPTVVEGSLADIWRDKAVASIDGHDVHTVVDEARKLGVPGLAKRNDGVSENRGRKLHAALSVFFRWLVRQRRVAVNPCAGVWRPQPPAARDRVLSDDEIKSFWLATDAVGEPFRAALRLLLLTGARVSEITGMRRSELGDGGTWTIPGARTKNHRPHAVPLPPLALDILAAVRRIEGNLVFTTTGTSPISGWSKIKRALDAVMGLKVSPWRLHDLRRTAATGMAEIGIAPHIVEAVLNHVSGARAGAAGIYNRAIYAAEKTAALQRWAAHIEGLVAGRKTNVVALPGGSHERP